MKRRILWQALLTGAPGAAPISCAATSFIDVCKSASCGCCTEWGRYLETSGFKGFAHSVANPAN